MALVEIDKQACATLRHNRPDWNVLEMDVHEFSAAEFAGVDLLAGGVPCPPFSVAGKQLGHDDDRDLFPEALRLVKQCSPRAVMLENVRGLFDPKFAEYRARIVAQLEELGYVCDWRLLQTSHYGVPQQRPRTVLVALQRPCVDTFTWPLGVVAPPPTVGDLLKSAMAANGWEGAEEWAAAADSIAPTLVGGSKKHGGADLGPTRARQAWARLGVDGSGVADAAPAPGFTGMPKLTVGMAALVQGFPPDWIITGRKTAAYKQVGNAFPPPVARAVGTALRQVLLAQPAGLREAA
jgi:DNA (cytosine-5)-methyltransferase 1